MRRYISAHRATSEYFSNSFVFKSKIEKEGLPRDRTPDLGAGGPRFKSGRPDHLLTELTDFLPVGYFHYSPDRSSLGKTLNETVSNANG